MASLRCVLFFYLQDVYIDKGREKVFERANIMTAFAVPIMSGKQATPVGVVCCYSMIQSGSVPFVLRFVQQALHLLWSGLDKVQPHESLGQEMWQDVGPADLGEMAADMEMQHHFLNKKRPREDTGPAAEADEPEPLSANFKNIDFHRDDDDQRPRGFSFSNFIPVEEEEGGGRDETIQEFYNYQDQAEPQQYQYELQQPPPRQQQQQQPSPPPQQQQPQPPMQSQQVSVQAMHAFQNHIKEAVRQVGEVLPFTHAHVSTTADGSKRAHLSHEPQPIKRKVSQPAPLAMPHALPTQVMRSAHHGHGNEHGETIEMQNPPPYMPSTQVHNNMTGGPSVPAPAHNYGPPPHVQQTSSPPNASHPPQAPRMEPSKLSQNLLSEGMLQSIANQQYNFGAPAQGATNYQNQSHAPPYVAPIAPTSVGMPVPAPIDGMYQQQHVQQQHQPPSQGNNAFCMPASAGYATPDITHSSPSPSHMDEYETNDGMNGHSKLCRIQGCDEPSVARRPYCARHSGNRLCEHVGCNKCAQGSTRFCIAHGGGRRCTFPGCDKGARDKFFCAAHGGGKRCKFDGCNKSAVGGSSLCTAHGGGRRCAIDGCDKSAQSSTKYCVKHGGGKKCAQDGCEKVARGRTQYCAAVSYLRVGGLVA